MSLFFSDKSSFGGDLLFILSIKLPAHRVIEFGNRVHMFGYRSGDKLVGVMGIQELKGVTLIRHAYTLTSYQGTGVGKSLLNYLLQKKQSASLLVGTWRDATWAIRFYEKFGFVLQTEKRTFQLLKKYWKISSNQIANSVVLIK